MTTRQLPQGLNFIQPQKKLFVLILCVLFPIQIFSQTSRSDPFLDEQKMRHVQELVDLSVSDSRAADATELEAIKKTEIQRDLLRLKSIQNEPNLGPYLVALAGRIMVEKSVGFPGVFQAMAMRQDVDPKIIQFYIQKAKVLVESNPEKLPTNEYDFMKGIPSLLALHSTPENEDILLKMLKLCEKNNNISLKVVAGQALAKVGTARSIPALGEAVKWIHLHGDDVSISQFATQMEGYLSEVRTRTSGSDEQIKVEQSFHTPGASLKGGAASHPDAKENKQTGIWWLVLGAIIIGTAGLFWRTRKARK